MLRVKFAGALVVSCAFSLLLAAAAMASSITGSGGASDSFDNFGTIGMAGTINLTTPRAINMILTYADNQDPFDGVTCVFRTPGDVSFNGATLTIFVSVTDSCFETQDGDPVNNVGRFIRFYFFQPGNIVGQFVDLLDADGDVIGPQTVVGTIK